MPPKEKNCLGQFPKSYIKRIDELRRQLENEFPHRVDFVRAALEHYIIYRNLIKDERK